MSRRRLRTRVASPLPSLPFHSTVQCDIRALVIGLVELDSGRRWSRNFEPYFWSGVDLNQLIDNPKLAIDYRAPGDKAQRVPITR